MANECDLLTQIRNLLSGTSGGSDLIEELSDINVQTAIVSKGAAQVAVAQVTASTTAGTLAIARPTRRGLLVRNLDAAITVYIGPATVTSGNGFPILAGESVPVTWVGLWQVIAASGAPVVAVVDEYT